MKNVPFYGNTDHTHCFQAGIRMVLKHFFPDEEYSWEELDKFTGKAPGMWTWPMAGYLWLQERGIRIVHEELFDYTKFSKDPEGYLYEFYTPGVAKSQIEHADMKEEAKRAARFVKESPPTKRLPDIADIKRYLDKGYLVSCNVNSRKLNGKEGYSGHFILVIGYDGSGVIMHDPGSPPRTKPSRGLRDVHRGVGVPDTASEESHSVRRYCVTRRTPNAVPPYGVK